MKCAVFHAQNLCSLPRKISPVLHFLQISSGISLCGKTRMLNRKTGQSPYQDECEQVEVERKFSLGKRKCGIGLVTVKLEDTAAHVVALSILLLNLQKIQYVFSGLAARLFATARKTEGCSVDIKLSYKSHFLCQS